MRAYTSEYGMELWQWDVNSDPELVADLAPGTDWSYPVRSYTHQLYAPGIAAEHGLICPSFSFSPAAAF